MNGAHVNQPKTSFSALINIPGKYSLFIILIVILTGRIRYGGYGDPAWGYGVRNIVFHTSGTGNGKPKVESWIRLEEGETRAHVWLDENYGR